MSGRDKFNRYKVVINFVCTIMKILPEFAVRFLWNFFNGFSGKIAITIRYSILKAKCKRCGENVFIGSNVYIAHLKNMSLGDNISIHSNCYIDSIGGISIGNNVSIAHNTSILSSNHTWKDKNIPIKYNSLELKPVIICDDVWIGCGVRILAGTYIDSRVVVAAGAVVNRNIKAKVLVGGVPAKIIKELE